jgi:hypothetical protein
LIAYANPRGNVQLCAARLAEMAGRHYLPEHWHHVRPLALRAIERHIPMTLQGLAGSSDLEAGYVYPWTVFTSDFWDHLKESLDVMSRPVPSEDDFKPPTPPPVPSAPPNSAIVDSKTRFDAWTPEMASATDNRNIADWIANAIPTPASQGTAVLSSNWVWVIAIAGVIGVLVLVRRK